MSAFIRLLIHYSTSKCLIAMKCSKRRESIENTMHCGKYNAAIEILPQVMNCWAASGAANDKLNALR
jgi:hypothetical protein